MTEIVKELIRQIAIGDIVKIKKAAINVLEGDNSQKDRSFCDRNLQKLRSEPMFIQLPTNISSFATMEDVSETFICKRYLLTDREKGLCDRIIAMDKVSSILSEKKIRHLNSTLLYGESGTGKTTFGRYLAYSLGVPFLYLNFSSLITSYLGGTGSNIQKVFEFAKQQRCVFMLDELDAIATKRGGKDGGTEGEMSRVVISLIQQLDTLPNQIILMAATNRYDIIDDAIKRRFGKKHEIKTFDSKEAKLFADKYLQNCGYFNTPTDKIISGVYKQSEIEEKIIEYIVSVELEDKTNEQLQIL